VCPSHTADTSWQAGSSCGRVDHKHCPWFWVWSSQQIASFSPTCLLSKSAGVDNWTRCTSYRVSNILCHLPISFQPYAKSNETSGPLFNAVSDEWNAWVVNRKPHPCIVSSISRKKLNSVAWVRERTIPTVGEVSAKRLRIEVVAWSACRIPTTVLSVF
jgi:hypothetical protein